MKPCWSDDPPPWVVSSERVTTSLRFWWVTPVSRIVVLSDLWFPTDGVLWLFFHPPKLVCCMSWGWLVFVLYCVFWVEYPIALMSWAWWCWAIFGYLLACLFSDNSFTFLIGFQFYCELCSMCSWFAMGWFLCQVVIYLYLSLVYLLLPQTACSIFSSPCPKFISVQK